VDGVAIEKPIPASQPGDIFPAGVVALYAGATPPTGWLFCDGTAVSRATYDDLFAAIGVTWGAGNGSTTFNIPDFRDRVPVGKSAGKALASTGGAETHTLTTGQMPAHSHNGATGTQSAFHSHQLWQGDFLVSRHNSGPGYAFQVTPGSGGTPYNTQTEAEASGHTHAISAEGGGAAHNIMQPYAAINYMIRAY